MELIFLLLQRNIRLPLYYRVPPSVLLQGLKDLALVLLVINTLLQQANPTSVPLHFVP